MFSVSYSMLPLSHPLQHIQHGIIYRVANNIFNMVSEPNFVLGIKQTSLTSKEDSHVHTTIRSHTCLSAGFRLHNISQPPWLSAMSKIHKLKQTRNINLIFVQSRLRLTKPTTQTCPTASRKKNQEVWSPLKATRASTS